MPTVLYQLILLLLQLESALKVNSRSGGESWRLIPSLIEEIESYRLGAVYEGWDKLEDSNPGLEKRLHTKTIDGKSRR